MNYGLIMLWLVQGLKGLWLVATIGRLTWPEIVAYVTWSRVSAELRVFRAIDFTTFNVPPPTESCYDCCLDWILLLHFPFMHIHSWWQTYFGAAVWQVKCLTKCMSGPLLRKGMYDIHEVEQKQHLCVLWLLKRERTMWVEIVYVTWGRQSWELRGFSAMTLHPKPMFHFQRDSAFVTAKQLLNKVFHRYDCDICTPIN